MSGSYSCSMALSYDHQLSSAVSDLRQSSELKMLYYSKRYVMSALPMLLWFFVSAHVSLADMTVVLGVILTSTDMDHAKLIG